MNGRRPTEDPGPAAGVALDAWPTGYDRQVPAFGPYDEDDLDGEDLGGRVDFGAVRVPLPAAGTVSVEPAAGGKVQAVHVMLPQGRLSVSALAAPRSDGLWPELAAEIHSSLRDGGARVRSFQGEWGRELHARTGDAASVFVGVDGPRWMLYGVATGPVHDATALDAELRRMLKGTVVARGRSPYPVRTVLPLVVPDGVQETELTAAAPTPIAPSARRPADPVTEPIPPVPVARPGHAPDPPTNPIPVLGGPCAGPAVPRAWPDDAPPAPRAPSTSPSRQPALAFLMGDPLELFAAAAPSGRHRRD